MTVLAGTGLQVRVAGRDVTARVTDQLTFSAVDPGGYETCQFSLPDGETPVRKGDVVVVFDGLGEVWWGRVEEPGARVAGGRTSYQVQAVGAGAALKDDQYACVYVDRDLSGWGGITKGRNILLLGASWQIASSGDVQTNSDASPVLVQSFQINGTPIISEAVYDASALCHIGGIYADGVGTNIGTFGSPGWSTRIVVTDDDNNAGTSLDPSYEDVQLISAATTFSKRFTATVGRRFAMLQFLYSGAANLPGSDRTMSWANLAVYGNHGLALRGPEPGGFYPSDIARHALQHATGIQPGAIHDADSYIVSHSVYKEPTTPEQVIDDMAKLMGWHWGVWGPDSILDTVPRLHFRPPPPEATAACSRLEAEDFQIADQLSSTYDAVTVGWQDAAGTRNYETVTQPNDSLPQGVHRTGTVDIGTSSQAGAQAFGRNWLLLTQRAQRAGGQCTLPQDVITPSGATRRALTLKPGLDRLRFTDLPSDGQNLLETDTRRFDTFRLKRTETTVEQGGIPRTRVEFDTGADLISTLQGRLDAATKLATG